MWHHECRICSFKRLSLSIDFIETEVRKTWNDLCQTIFDGKLKESTRINKKGEARINATGVISTEINFLKSKNYEVFLRGSGIDSNNKLFCLCGIDMYHQWIWIKGEYIIYLLEKDNYL